MSPEANSPGFGLQVSRRLEYIAAQVRLLEVAELVFFNFLQIQGLSICL